MRMMLRAIGPRDVARGFHAEAERWRLSIADAVLAPPGAQRHQGIDRAGHGSIVNRWWHDHEDRNLRRLHDSRDGRAIHNLMRTGQFDFGNARNAKI